MVSEPVRERSRHRLGVGAAIVAVLVALAVTVGIGILRGSAAETQQAPVDTERETVETAAPVEVYVHVAGAVATPGLYRLFAEARVVDAIAAAGGFVEGADRAAVNLARTVGDGEQVVVPLIGEAPAAPDVAATGAGAGEGRVNLNSADIAALDTLPRIGPALAQRIVDWRDENGRFTSVEDLLAVPGIGDKMLESLRDLVTV